MKGDFSRDTFDPRNHFVRVLTQQGRVQLDADENESQSIYLHLLRSLAADIIGPHGAPGSGFRIGVDAASFGPGVDTTRLPLQKLEAGDFWIHPGHYYVNGILCENEDWTSFQRQPDLLLDDNRVLDGGPYLVYLDVWERHITYLQDDSIREVALGGPDTATRARLVWQVKTWPAPGSTRNGAPSGWTCTAVRQAWEKWLNELQPAHRGLLQARAGGGAGGSDTEPCITPPDARYRGAENQLYRVEIQHGGTVADATFKWSRDNGTVVYAIQYLNTNGSDTTTVALEHLGRDSRSSLNEGDWVEIVNDDNVLRGRPGQLLQVIEVDRMDLVVRLAGTLHASVDPDRHPLLRRWDQKATGKKDDAPRLADGVRLEELKWLELENGINVYFSAGGNYRTGDYWLIPARAATGNVEWLQNGNEPVALPPHGVQHYYAPLAILNTDGQPQVEDCRLVFEPLAKAQQG